MGIEVADALQKLHFRHQSLFAEQSDGIRRMAGDASELQVGINEPLHLAFQAFCHLCRNALFDIERAEESAGNRRADAQACAGKEVMDCLVEHEE